MVVWGQGQFGVWIKVSVISVRGLIIRARAVVRVVRFKGNKNFRVRGSRLWD